jgi:hypothetical protein
MESLILRAAHLRGVSKDGRDEARPRTTCPPSLLRNFGATAFTLRASACLPSRSPQGEGRFETALEKRLLTMRFLCGLT